MANIAEEYFERIKPSVEKHNPYTFWGISVIQQDCKRVLGELAVKYDLTEEAVLQAIRAYQKAPADGGQAA